MADTWREEIPALPSTAEPHRATKWLTLSPLVERALQRELVRRRDLRPHAQLGIGPDASWAVVESSFARLRSEYDPHAFEGYGERAVAAATDICALLRTAHTRMQRRADAPAGAESPSVAAEPPLQPLQPLRPQREADETLRARETLRVAIERRLSDADAHRHAGRTREAIRGYESVLLLDRTNEQAREQLDRLRGPVETPTRARSWLAILRRPFG